MFYELLKFLFPNLAMGTYFRIFGYTSVRVPCALACAFITSLLIGPAIIRRLIRLKAGQPIKQFKTAEFNIHQHKHGTPTMGGIIILFSTTLAVLLFCDPGNSYVWMTLLMMLGAGALGFADDYKKVALKDNKGVSAKTKLIVQTLLGLLLGVFLYLGHSHTAYGPLLLENADILNRPAFVAEMQKGKTPLGDTLRAQLPLNLVQRLDAFDGSPEAANQVLPVLLKELNTVIQGKALYDPQLYQGIALTDEARERLESYRLEQQMEPGKERPESGRLEPPAIPSTRLNRYLLESAYPTLVAHNKVVRGDAYLLVPFFKNVYPYMGVLFIFWVAFVLVSSSNAVNLTDGLDGLAISTVITVSLPYLMIAYLVSRFDFASYLYVPHIPQAGELSVFMAAMLGSALGFLWFNSHPAEVFMGDTGSLALGAAIGAVAVLTKHEILLILIGGIFVIEAFSVVLQIASYRLRGKRILLMSPLHNHFVKKGVNEAKIISRFFIFATILAMAGLSTLKLR
ncbi:MAG TPA: phospho-N-acetylmuramoyl-pentapeptide-transferase [Candidatus Sumerlaeota bacterium]|nr:phospho-N-acetylmuramoyl-pentapeptide-transferase [Candidatus Sumerlaeota bacterium]HPS01213.1 phospho-N-acetylmuramoyl-pentapeptide-transferase [Candidatus Sumerlaeota bacterium]